jgi:hypothetical protein
MRNLLVPTALTVMLGMEGKPGMWTDKLERKPLQQFSRLNSLPRRNIVGDRGPLLIIGIKTLEAL